MRDPKLAHILVNPLSAGVEIGEALRKSITGLFGKHVREDGE